MGELLLWSALADRQTRLGLTLPPLNPLEQPSYARWQAFASAAGLPCLFEVGGPEGLAYSENLAAADALLTTSVAEGFGLVFLECWLVGRPLLGRDLPEITADFVRSGIRFPGLQAHLGIPVDWLDWQAFRATMVEAFLRVLEAYGQPLPTGETLGRQVDQLGEGGVVDFGRCGSAAQRQVIQRVVGDAGCRQQLLGLNPAVAEALGRKVGDRGHIDENARIVRREYSLVPSGRRLGAVYQRVAGSPRGDDLRPLAEGHRVLDHFLDLSRFCPLRVES
ncbi:MAG: hypothetical protein GTO03_05935 [Planctomycetales bacterium]|nr:hypothetical protein [Planctomycetales bacterium]